MDGDKKRELSPVFHCMPVDMFDSLCDSVVQTEHMTQRPAQLDGSAVPLMPKGVHSVRFFTKPYPNDSFKYINFTNKAVQKTAWTFWDEHTNSWAKEKAKYPRWETCLKREVLTLLQGHSRLTHDEAAEKFKASLSKENLQWMFHQIQSHVEYAAKEAISKAAVIPSAACATPPQLPSAPPPHAASHDLSERGGLDTTTTVMSMAVSEDDDDGEVILYIVIIHPLPRKPTRSAIVIDRVKLELTYADELIEAHTPDGSRDTTVIQLFDVERGTLSLRAGRQISEDYVKRQCDLGASLLLSGTDKELVVQPRKAAGETSTNVLNFGNGGEVSARRSPGNTTEMCGEGSAEPMEEFPRSSSNWGEAIVRMVHMAGLASSCPQLRPPTVAEAQYCNHEEERVNSLELVDAGPRSADAVEPMHVETKSSKTSPKVSRPSARRLASYGPPTPCTSLSVYA